MQDSERLVALLESAWTNALIGWVVVGFLGITAVLSAVTGDVLWAGFCVVVIALAGVVPVAYRRASVMLPWEVLVLAALPVIGRAFATVPLTSRFATYLSVAALALIVAVELHLFTPVVMTSGFAVLFVVVSTLAAAGAWAVARWALDITLGTGFLLDPSLSEAVIERRLMWEFVYSTLAGVAGGVIFEWYFRRRAAASNRVPDGVRVRGS